MSDYYRNSRGEINTFTAFFGNRGASESLRDETLPTENEAPIRNRKKIKRYLGYAAAALAGVAGIAALGPRIANQVMDAVDPQFECSPQQVHAGDTIYDMVEHETEGLVDPRPSVDKTVDNNQGIDIANLQPGQEIDLCVQVPR